LDDFIILLQTIAVSSNHERFSKDTGYPERFLKDTHYYLGEQEIKPCELNQKETKKH